ncbi:selenocysteine-specific elongation factor [Topomyia yanbarensis]|uniref:selenocysteine-specific elongation factor n=1 Tax=Topomyia yanbarensis TaxID=2498891 RepID=UPI00273B26A7|nr:selenocysteine-specific elongation factor [Topomyia yanbarensis]XP_058834057.1 selenocysteine-specific elongation factor [Topomyia yanbarensis]XP_058834058.1 selenocysteine-specific elongation factor [Topomyia yanbarensis]
MLNLNVGLLGHVDSGKTTLAKALSAIASTASFDKNPQSQQRGITLDLGFSALQTDLPNEFQDRDNWNQLQYTFVDCPGHASLIRTIIGAAQIIDLIILVVDIGKGIQTQTAECLVIGELTTQKMIVALNKIDTIEESKRAKSVEKMKKGLGVVLMKTVFEGSPIVEISAFSRINLDKFLLALKSISFAPVRSYDMPFLFAVDHCFAIKGQGTICTGTVLQGQIKLNEEVEIPKLKLVKKVKSIQMFRQSQQAAQEGDRVGICIAQFDPKLLERGLICKPGFVLTTYATIVGLNRIKYYKGSIRSKAKFHVHVGYETVLACVTLFKSEQIKNLSFDSTTPYEFIEEVNAEPSKPDTHVFALLEFEHAIQATPRALVIASKLDTDIHKNQCRLAFFGRMEYHVSDRNYKSSFLPQLKIYKLKHKVGSVQRVVNANELIASGMFKKEGNNRQAFVGFQIQLSTGELGVIEDTFGASSKVRLRFMKPLDDATLARLRQKTNSQDPVKVGLKFKKYIFAKDEMNNKVVQ